MNSSAFCPRCGSLLSAGCCTVCGVLVTPALQSSVTSKRSKTLGIVLVSGAVYLVVVATLLGFMGQRLMRKIKARQAWNQTHLASNRPAGRTIETRHDGPIAHVSELKGNGRIYLVQVGDHKDPYSVDDFAQWLHFKYKLDVQVLPAMAADKSAWDATRKQYVAELLYDQIKREHSDLAANPDIYLIGFTDADMYSVNNRWSSTFTQRDLQRSAIISADGMQDNAWQRANLDSSTVNQHFQARLRRILLKDIATLYWHLPLNNDPTSLLRQPLNPSLPVDDIYESDLEPTKTGWGESEVEPCIILIYSAKDGIKPLPGRAIRECGDKNIPEHDESLELFEVDLRLGLLIDKHTDFNLPGTVPIQFQRTTRDGWRGLNPFGVSGTDNYEEFLYSTDNSHISIIHADGGRDELVRVPIWLPIQSMVKWVDTDYSGKHFEMRWYSSPFGHYDVKRFDGEIKTYLSCNGPKEHCYLEGIHNASGQDLKFVRDSNRRLIQLTSPNNSWLHFSHGPSGQITEIEDSNGRTVHYDYDEHNRLIGITYPSGEVFHYEYDSTQHLLSFSVAQDAKSAPLVLLRNEYENGRIMKQSFADGRAYLYSYNVASNGAISLASVRTPDGRAFDIDFDDNGSTVREHKP